MKVALVHFSAFSSDQGSPLWTSFPAVGWPPSGLVMMPPWGMIGFRSHRDIMGMQIKEASKLILPRGLHLKSMQGRSKSLRDSSSFLGPST